MASKSSLGIIRHGPCGAHVAPPHSYHPQVTTSTWKVHPPSNPTTGLDPHLTHRIEGNSTFDVSVPFPFFTPILWSPEFQNSQRNLKSHHVAPAFGPFNIHSTLHSKPLESRSLGHPKGPPSHVVTYWTQRQIQVGPEYSSHQMNQTGKFER
jgi:hypothetical protein